MDNTYGPTCPQVDPNPPTCPNKNGREPIIPRTPRDSIIAEDCLFLDIYVPKSAWDNKQLAKTPVVVWIFGGAFVFGSKNTDFTPFYNATGLLQTGSKTPPAGNFIFVTGNYRVGALGWLAGITMEAQALPNAGLYDQRLVFEWVQKYISLVGGDNKQVSAWGESAGASSIMHHLVSKNGAQDPLFTSALLQSPAYQLRWDRTGTLESIFYNFTNIAGCAGSYPKDAISCLQKLDTSTIVKATQKIVADIFSITGGLPFGPSVDGNLIQTLAPVSLYTGRSRLTVITSSEIMDQWSAIFGRSYILPFFL